MQFRSDVSGIDFCFRQVEKRLKSVQVPEKRSAVPPLFSAGWEPGKTAYEMIKMQFLPASLNF